MKIRPITASSNDPAQFKQVVIIEVTDRGNVGFAAEYVRQKVANFLTDNINDARIEMKVIHIDTTDVEIA